MELIQGPSCKASKFEPEDFISNMPDNVVSNILDRLQLQEAVRTGILARNWRFKWNMLSQLVFDENFFKYLLKTKREKSYGRVISRLLLHLKGGVITKFVLYAEQYTCPVLDDEDINNWILFLSKNGIKDLTFRNIRYPLKLPTHLFSCLELKHLNLDDCCFDPLASFHGFPNLLSLGLCDVDFESRKTVEFFTRCPVLETLNMLFTDYNQVFSFVEDDTRKGSLTIFPCLKTLKLSNIDLSSGAMISYAFEIVRSSPNLQILEITTSEDGYNEDGGIKRSPVTFPCLKTLKLLELNFGNGNMLSFAYEMIMSSPNLQTLEITGGGWYFDEEECEICSFEVDDSTRMLQLRSVVFRGLEALENEVCLIKYLLACSPFLKKIAISHAPFLKSKKKYMFAKKLLELHRASPFAEISLY